MSYYPIALDLTNKKCLIVGGGEVAFRKAKSLVEAGARVTVIAREIDPRIEQLGGIEAVHQSVSGSLLSALCPVLPSFTLIFAATDDRELNAAIYREAVEKGMLVNVVDDPELCSFISPSVVRRGDLIIAITTSGKSPALSKKIRREIETRYGEEYAAFVDLMGEIRDDVKAKYSSHEERDIVFNHLIDSGILELLRQGKTNEALEKAKECI